MQPLLNFARLRTSGRSLLSARSVLLTLLVVAAVVAGAVFRFRGLGKWPLAMDEYYLARSIQNVLRVGLPQYPCGGFYVRGLAIQYGGALLRAAGFSAELTTRLIAAVSSLLALPAVFLIGRRLGGRHVAVAAVVITALSVWEVEMARFGRMYAPFQAVFLWYVVFFLEWAVDRRARALGPMLGLSVLGVLVWEGGALLAFANLLALVVRTPSGRFTRQDWGYLAGALLLFAIAYRITTLGVLPSGSLPALPADYHEPLGARIISRLDAGALPLRTLGRHPLWWVLAALPAGATLRAVIRLRGNRARPLGQLALIAALVAALLQQFGFALEILGVSLLLRVIHWQDVAARSNATFRAALLASASYWIAYGLAVPEWHEPGLTLPHTLALLGYELIRVPDVLRVVVVPLARVVPILGAALLVLVGAAALRAMRRARDADPAQRTTLGLILVLLVAASAAPLPRYETRYVFFLYPLAVVIAARVIATGTSRLLRAPALAAQAALLLTLLGFGLTEDFKPQHLLKIDSAEINFRIGMSEREAAHYHPRSDVRAAAAWLNAHVHRSQDIVVNAFPSLDFYFPSTDFFFMEESDPRFEACSCRSGTVERWSNRPLLHSLTMLQSQVATGRTVWLVTDAQGAGSLTRRLPHQAWQLAWRSRGERIDILSLRPPSQGALLQALSAP